MVRVDGWVSVRVSKLLGSDHSQCKFRVIVRVLLGLGLSVVVRP